jgi:predicted 2-oxoglutarate/Fe(II)-dependent dioxygenase YbiX
LGLKLQRNLSDYIKVYHNHIDDDICKQTIDELNAAVWHEHTFDDYDNKTKIKLSGNQELSTSYDNVSTKDVLMKQIWEGLNQYIIKDFHFSWLDGWNGFTPLRFNQYKENKKMAEHCDHIIINEAGTRKGIPVLSIIGSLNDDYEGGEFIMFQDEEIKLKQGDLMIFPSVFLYPHRVEPVTKGVRNTFVSWAW